MFPVVIVAGDSCSWESEFLGYDSSEWELSWAIRGAVGIDLAAQAIAGGKFKTTITSIQSATLTPGNYAIQGYVTRGEERTTVGSGFLRVANNLAGIEVAYDGRSEAEKLLDSVNAAISALVNDNVASYRIKEREVTKQNLAELIQWRDKIKIEVAREQRANLGESKKLYVRFK